MFYSRMKKRGGIKPWVYWTPRILSIVFILFLALFSLDVFGNDYGFWGTILAFLMHNIPVFVMGVILWIAWKHEIVGAIAFALAGIIYTIVLLMNPQMEWYMLSWSITISGPAFLIAWLYWKNWKQKKK
jgi:hypothetical protein